MKKRKDPCLIGLYISIAINLEYLLFTIDTAQIWTSQSNLQALIQKQIGEIRCILSSLYSSISISLINDPFPNIVFTSISYLNVQLCNFTQYIAIFF